MSIFKKIYSAFFTSQAEPCKVIMVGLDAAGKTTILYRLKGRHGEVLTTIPTIGFNVETLDKKDLTMTCWDIGGCDRIRPLYRHYFDDVSILIYVIDSNDRDRIENASEEFDWFIKELSYQLTPVLILANKQDLPDAMRVQEVVERYNLLAKLRGRQWFVCPTCAVTGDGLNEAVDWMRTTLKNVNSKTSSRSEEIPTTVAAAKVMVTPVTLIKEDTKDLEWQMLNAQLLQRSINRETILTHWLQRAQRDCGSKVNRDDEMLSHELFLSQVSDYSLQSWDHYTHLRLGFIFLSKCDLTDKNAVQLAVHSVCDLIQAFIQHCARTGSGKSFHTTMTYFWCILIARQIEVCRAENTTNDVSFEQFIASLRYEKALELWDGKVFSQYYTSRVMFSSDAKARFINADIKPLPFAL